MRYYNDSKELMFDETNDTLYNDAARTKFVRVLRDMGLDDRGSFFQIADYEADTEFGRCDITNLYSDCVTVLYYSHRDAEPIELEVGRNLSFCLIDFSYTYDDDFSMPA